MALHCDALRCAIRNQKYVVILILFDALSSYLTQAGVDSNHRHSPLWRNYAVPVYEVVVNATLLPIHMLEIRLPLNNVAIYHEAGPLLPDFMFLCQLVTSMLG